MIDAQVDDSKYLEPFYRKVHESIRQVDNDTILFFEPIVDDLYAVGLNEGPGGSAYNSKQALSYHVYCLDVDDLGEPKNALLCHGIDSMLFDSKYAASKRIGIAGFLTEFGALSNSTSSSEEVAYITGLCDKHLQSWAYWQYKSYNDITTAARPASTEGFF